MNPLGNGEYGIHINSASSNTISGNTISDNTYDGIAIVGNPTTGNEISGNFIGTDATGSSLISNHQAGIRLNTSDNIVGGTAEVNRNIISGNTIGVIIQGEDANNNQVMGNYIGTDAGGTVALGNSSHGIFIGNGTNNTIGPGNLISGNAIFGVLLIDTTRYNQVLGNYIGTDASGTSTLPNFIGVHIIGAQNNTIGGTGPGEGNLISGNVNEGILIYGYAWNLATDNVIQGNLIGTDHTGLAPLGNATNGIRLANNASDNLIGGTVPGAGNVIAFNGGFGVACAGISGPGTGNGILSNSIHSNDGLGIDLNHGQDTTPYGVTPNDPQDLDTGTNNLQNFPLLTSAGSDVDIINGTLHSTPNTQFRIEFFRNDASDPSGNGEGQTFIGAITVVTDYYGNTDFNAFLPGEILIGKFYSATATDPDNNTSEFCTTITTEIKTKSFGPHFITNQTYSGLSLHWPDGQTTFVVSQSVMDADPGFKQVIENSFATWSALPQLDFSCGEPSVDAVASNQWAGNPDNLNNNVWITDWSTTGLDENVVAATRIRYNAVNGEMTDVDIAYNADPTLSDPFQWSTTGDINKLDLQNVATHEIGHFSGLGDIYNPGDDPYYLPEMGAGNEEQTLYGLIKRGEIKKRDLYQYADPNTPEGDVAGIEYIYTNLPEERIDVVLVFDGSTNYVDTYQAFKPAKKAAIQLLDKLRIGDRIAVVQLPDMVIVPLTEILNDNIRAFVQSSIKGMSPEGTVAIGSGLQAAQGLLNASGSPNNKWAMILFSSGEETTRPLAEEVLPDIMATKTVIYTTSFSGGSLSGQDVNSHIADVTGGDYFLATDATEIVDIVNFIWYRLLGIQIIYLSEPRSTADLEGVPYPGNY